MKQTLVEGQRGFTLIEVLVAMLVFVTGMAGLLALLVTALALHRDGLNLARATRDLDQIRAVVAAEVAAGQHFDAQRGAWLDVASARLPDGSFYAVRFLAGDGEQPLRAELRMGASERDLKTAEAVLCALQEGESAAARVARFRQRIPPGDH